ncbi:MAG: hypothetical protein NT091_02720 [Candidatus Falkowbacteria bacterium]|nr:hypothetical protein [Candidatus Falkowbacteria bacterium]
MIARININAQLIQPTINAVKDFLEYEPIGEVYVAGSWNNWGDSPEKAGCIRPKKEYQMRLEAGRYVWEGNISIGLHEFKPVVITSTADTDGMCNASWIKYPERFIKFYSRAPNSKHGNWQIILKPPR